MKIAKYTSMYSIDKSFRRSKVFIWVGSWGVLRGASLPFSFSFAFYLFFFFFLSFIFF